MAERRVWVTGARGFIGAHLCERLSTHGVKVVRFGRSMSPGETAGKPILRLDRAGLKEALARFGAPDEVYHLAGGPTVGRSLTDPLGDFESNVATTALLLDVLRTEAPEAHFLLASSAAVYGEGHSGPIALDAVTTPSSPYGHHKRMAERLGLSFAESFGLKVTILRFFSVYGPGIQKQLLHDICTRLSQGERPLVLGGTGSEVRDWCHVSDVVAGMVSVAAPPPGEVSTFNLATGRGLRNASLVAALLKAWSPAPKVIFTNEVRPGDPFSLVADPKSLPPGFVPEVELEAGLEGFVEWFRHAQWEVAEK